MKYPRHILIADDDYAVRTVVRRAIFTTCSPVTVSATANGRDALAAYERGGADLVITNHDMPGMDGVSLTRAIRARDEATPIVMLASDAAVEGQARRAGVTQFLRKPGQLRQLSKIITQLLFQR